ncbi:MAG TPA: SUMF1/EgtB/PvdO family nonheme iron enzyme [Gemmataceae bacterium]|jgi:serine/threonine protein kinase|nr:SUMF1/EgtB/PvdO family nonheme iron enzyme [Gemmataceae bacterium]
MRPLVCPTDGELSEFALGCLSAERLEEVAGHLDDCPACSTRLIRIGTRSDSLAEAVRAAGTVAGFAPATPTALRDYRIEDVLGEGGMGTVYRAVHTRLGRTVALKLLTASRRLDPDAGARFEREALAIGALRHPHIVQPTDAGEIDGVPFLVMEFVEGTDLGKLVKARGPLKAADACEAARQAALGLSHAHEHGLVHRDVKPGNLMLASDGSVKLLDLGLARTPGTDEATVATDVVTVARDNELTATNMLVGTRAYMAPEQRADPRRVDPRADVFALGRTLCFLLSGKPDLPAAGTVPGGLLKVLQRLQAEQPGDRYPSAAAVANALRPWSREQDLGALAGRPKRRRFRARWVVLPVAALAIIGGGITLAVNRLNRPQTVEETHTLARQAPPAGSLPMSDDEARRLQKTWADYLGQKTEIANDMDMKLILVPPGSINHSTTMTATITRPYWLGATEVTRGQFRRFVAATNYRTEVEQKGTGAYHWVVNTGKINVGESRSRRDRKYSWENPGHGNLSENQPVTQVSWNDAIAFCNWLSQGEGKTYRLPTRTELHWAMRAGEAGDYPGDHRDGDILRSLGDYAWTSADILTQPKAVGMRQPNAWGLFDMLGNVEEWGQDWWGALPTGTHEDYAGPSTGKIRVLVGGAYTLQPAFSWLAALNPDGGSSTAGFRVLREP